MAKRKKILELTPKFYVAYTDDKQIIAVTNFKDPSFTNIIEIDFVSYEKFI